MWDVPGILTGCPGPLGVFKTFVQKKFVRIFRSLIEQLRIQNLAPAILCYFSGIKSMYKSSSPEVDQKLDMGCQLLA